MSEDLQWFLGLNLVLSIWLGMLAEHWKGRSMARWMAIGLVMSIFGALLLALLSSVKHKHNTVAVNKKEDFGVLASETPLTYMQ